MAGMLCSTINDYPQQGAMSLFFSVRDCVPLAFPALLLGVFILIFAGNYFINKEKTGRDRVLVAFLASSFALIPLSMMFALATLVTFTNVIIYAFLTIIAFILLYVSDKY